VSEANGLNHQLGADYGPKPFNHHADHDTADSAVGHRMLQASTDAAKGQYLFLRTRHMLVIEQNSANQKITTNNRTLIFNDSMDK
jgi:hypothetical protein